MAKTAYTGHSRVSVRVTETPSERRAREAREQEALLAALDGKSVKMTVEYTHEQLLVLVDSLLDNASDWATQTPAEYAKALAGRQKRFDALAKEKGLKAAKAKYKNGRDGLGYNWAVGSKAVTAKDAGWTKAEVVNKQAVYLTMAAAYKAELDKMVASVKKSIKK